MMGALVIRFPRTAGGAQMLFHAKKYDGLKPVYPDGSKIENIDWDQAAVDCQRIFDDLCEGKI